MNVLLVRFVKKKEKTPKIKKVAGKNGETDLLLFTIYAHILVYSIGTTAIYKY